MCPVGIHRPEALSRAAEARALMSCCRLCALACGADRTHGPAGACRADGVSRVFGEGIEWAGEEGIVPTYVVSLSGCNLSCRFCLTGEGSQDAGAGSPLDPEAVAARIDRAAPHLRSVTILGGEPVIHMDGALEIAARVPRGLRVVWKTNATASGEGRSLMAGLPDLVLADCKFGNDRCAEALAGIPGYTRIVRENLLWAARTAPLVVRHLLMPGHLDCCLVPVAHWLASELPRTPLSLMAGYLPSHRAVADPILGRLNYPADVTRARELASALGLQIMPWTMDPHEGVRPVPAETIWIDRNGRICVDMASAELIPVLKRIAAGLV